jgi:succinate-semialdehyde dehydrogenase/glutarate-semialdehyde dehydrogenase
MAIQSINPYTLERLKSFEEMTETEIENAITKAHETYQVWKVTSFEERAKVLNKVASIIREKKAELSKLITLEMGKLIKQAEYEIDYAASIFEYYANNAKDFLADEPLKVDFGEAYIKKSPIGVLLGVEPWNFPFYQVARFAAPNIMIGNTIVLKTRFQCTSMCPSY